MLQGRTLDVVRAVTRDEAGKLKEEGERQREKADKRNLYLLREGSTYTALYSYIYDTILILLSVIMPNTPAAELLPSAEVEKRTQSFNARRALLRSNPLLYVSRTRLSIRQLPLFATERMLKRLAIHAVRSFESEVKAGKRSGLTEDELTEPLPDPDADDPKERTAKGKGKAAQTRKGRSTGVQQAKIVRQQDRVDAATGKGRSRGYGFLEMETHADALRVLRWSNNNLDVSKLLDTWWKEELEDLVKLEKKKEEKEEGRLERLKKSLLPLLSYSEIPYVPFSPLHRMLTTYYRSLHRTLCWVPYSSSHRNSSQRISTSSFTYRSQQIAHAHFLRPSFRLPFLPLPPNQGANLGSWLFFDGCMSRIRCATFFVIGFSIFFGFYG